MTDSATANRTERSARQPRLRDSADTSVAHSVGAEAIDSHLWWLLFEHAGDPMLVVNRNGKIIHANAATEKHPAGRSRVQLIGHTFLDLVTAATRPAASQAWEKVVTGRAPLRIENELERRDGGVICVEMCFTPLPKRELFTVTIRDSHPPVATSQPARARANYLAVLNTISETLGQALALLDTDLPCTPAPARETRDLPLPFGRGAALSGEWDELFKAVLIQSLEALDVEAGAIALAEETTRDLVFSTHHGWQNHDPVAEGTSVKAGMGWSGLAVRTGQVVVTDDITGDPRRVEPEPLWGQEGVQALALAPMRTRNQVVGVLSAVSHQPHQFSQQDQHLLAAVADQIGLALDNLYLYIKTQRRLQEQSALHEVALATQGMLSLQTVMDQGLRALIALFELNAAAIHFLDNQGRLVPVTTQGSDAQCWHNAHQKPPQLEATLAGRYALRKKSLVIQDLETFEEPVCPELQTSGIRTLVYVPLLVSGRLLGLLALAAKRPSALCHEDLPLLESLGAQLASAIETARLHEQTERRVQNLTTLTQVSAMLNKALSLDEIFQAMLNGMLPLVTAKTEQPISAIFLVEPDQQRLRMAACCGLSEEFVSRCDAPPASVYDMLSNDKATEIVQLTLNGSEVWREIAPSLTGIALRVEEHPIGAILIAGQTADKDIHRLLLGLADMAAVAIDKARLYEETQHRLDEVALLHKIALAATSALDFDLMISRAVDAIQQTLGFEYVGLLLLDESGDYLSPHPSFFGIQQSDLQRKVRVGEGVCGRVLQTGKPLRVPDISLVENFVDVIPGVQSELCVPLKVGEHVIGVIDVESSQLEAFSSDDERILTTIAGQLAVTIENARLHQETQHRLREMTTLFNFAQHLSTNLDMDLLLDTIVTSIREVLGCRGVSIALLGQDNQMLEIKAAAGLKQKWRETARLQVGEGIMGQVAATGKSIYVPDAHKMEGFIFFDRSFHSLLTVPLITKDQVVGTMSVDHTLPDAFSADDERLVTIAATQAAVAIENARLFKDVQERAAHLTRAYAELKEIDRLKDELLQNVSHELRTPLTFIRGYVDLLLSGDMGPLDEQQSQSLEIVSAKTRDVTQLVNNIMLLQQLEHSTLQLALTDVITVVAQALTKAQTHADQQSVSLHLEAPTKLPLVLSDADQLRQVFRSLLDNAIKFSPDGGQVWIQLEEQPDCIQVAVRDQGIGIPQDKLDRVFERFYQVDGSATRRFEGTGLGLTVAKQVVLAHGGKIWAESQLGKGSTFYFTLPKSRKDQRGYPSGTVRDAEANKHSD